MTSQGTSVASNGAELARNRKSRVTLNKVKKAKLFERCTAHEVERTNGRARMRAVTEVVTSARFHLVMDREKDKYFSIGTECITTVMQSLTSGNVENLLKNILKTYIVGMQLQKDENGNEYPCRREGLGKDYSARQLLLNEASFVYISQLSLETLTVSRHRVSVNKETGGP
jgi:hypothetical protein